MNSNVLYDNSDEIISYVTSKIKKFEPQQFEQQVKYYINEYCEKYLCNISPVIQIAVVQIS